HVDAARGAARWNAAELLFDPAQHVVGVDVADDDHGGVVGNVVPTVVLIKIVTAHRPEVGQPANRGMAIGMHLVSGGNHVLLEQRIRIVFTALQFGNDDGSFRLAIV